MALATHCSIYEREVLFKPLTTQDSQTLKRCTSVNPPIVTKIAVQTTSAEYSR